MTIDRRADRRREGFQVRLFKTPEEAETWTRAAVSRRFRSTKIGSALWIRALHKELRAAQREGFAEGSVQQTGNLGSNAVLNCDETEARNLLLYAGHCPGRGDCRREQTESALGGWGRGDSTRVRPMSRC